MLSKTLRNNLDVSSYICDFNITTNIDVRIYLYLQISLWSNKPIPILDCPHVFFHLTGGGYQISLTPPVSLNKRASIICHLSLYGFTQSMQNRYMNMVSGEIR